MNEQEIKRSLLVGIGNSAREDDGLGWAFVEQVEQEGFFQGDCLYRFQLNLEDAELISAYDCIIFVDAHKGILANGFSLRLCVPDAGTGFCTHQLSPESILYLCQQLYMKLPQAWVLGIQGYQWELGEELSLKALGNLDSSLKGFQVWIDGYKQEVPG